VIPNSFIQSNLRGFPFIAPECVLTATILIVLVVGVSFSFRHRSTFTTSGSVSSVPAIAV